MNKSFLLTWTGDPLSLPAGLSLSQGHMQKSFPCLSQKTEGQSKFPMQLWSACDAACFPGKRGSEIYRPEVSVVPTAL